VPLYSPNPDAPTSYGGGYTSVASSSPTDAVGEYVDKALNGLTWDNIKKGVNWAGTRLTKGANGILGMPTNIQELGNSAAKIALEKMVGPGHATTPMPSAMPDSADLNRYVFGSLGVPEVNSPPMPVQVPGTDKTLDVGKIIDTGAEMIPGAVAGPAGAMNGVGSRVAATTIPAVMGGAAGETAGQLTAGTPYEGPARLIFGALGFGAGSKATTPLPAKLSPNEARIVQIAKDNGLPLTVAQQTGRLQGLETALSRFPTSASIFEKAGVNQNATANRMALKEVGVDGTHTDPEAMKKVYQQVSNEFGTALKNTGPVTLTPNFYNKAQRITSDYVNNPPESGISPVVQKKMNDFFDPKLMKGGAYPTLSPDEYQSIRYELNQSMQNMKPGDGAYKALKGLRGALDDAMEASAGPNKAAAIQAARKHWANLKVLLRAAAGGTADSRTEGNLAPGALNSALRSAQGPDKFATTTGGLNDVAALKDYLKNTFPNSGTPTVGKFHEMMEHGASALAGGLVGGEHFGALSPHVAVPAAAAAMVPNLMARAMTGRGFISRPMRNYLANQTMPWAYPYGIRSAPLTLAPLVSPLVPRLEDQR
jgi:hypothetical protein